MRGLSLFFLVGCGQTAVGGLPEQPKPQPSACAGGETVVAEVDDLTSLLVRGTELFFIHAPQGTTWVQVKELSSPAEEPRLLAAFDGTARTLAVTDRYAYWWRSRSALQRAPLQGGQYESVSTSAPGHLAADADAVYFNLSGALARLRDGASEPEILAEAASPLRIALTSSHIYWLRCDSVQRVPKTAGPTETVATAACAEAGLAIDADEVFWLDQGALKRTIAGTTETMATLVLGSIAIDETHVYFRRATGIFRVDRTTGFDELVREGSFTELTTDEDCLYLHAGSQILAIPK